MVRRLEVDDLTKFNMVSSPQLSLDASMVAFVVTVPEGDKYKDTIWIIDSNNGESLRFYSDGDPANPRWSPKGEQLMFTSSRDIDEKKKETGIWVTKTNGEPRLICKVKGGVSSPCWDNAGKRIFFLSNVGDEDSEVRLVDRIPIWYNGEGWTYYRSKHLHVVDVDSGYVIQVTSGENDVQCFSICGDDNKLAIARSYDPAKPNESELYIHGLTSSKTENILLGYNISSLIWSPQSDKIAFMGHDGSHGYPTNWCIYVVDQDGDNLVNLTDSLDRGSSRRHYYDVRGPHTALTSPVWVSDWIYFPVSNGPCFTINRVNLDSQIESVVEGDFSIEEFDVRGDKVAYTKVNTTRPANVCVKNVEEACLTFFNESLLHEVKLSEASTFSFTQRDGARVEGWVLKPYSYQTGKKYPAVLDIHGGPRSKFGSSMMFEHQLYAANGYGVIYINVPGSDGYSQDFADIKGQWGVWDYEDLMKGVDSALEKFSWIDDKRLGVTGLSYGGFMTNWVITHTNRFKAAISQNSICSWTSFFGTSDIGFHFTPDQIGGTPWSNLKKIC
jgi:dipeptidyl aminopeptidase/acylaminoacyl peptidase